jgi:hypothetical protein
MHGSKQIEVYLEDYRDIDLADVSNNHVILKSIQDDLNQLRIPVKKTTNKISVQKLRDNLSKKLPLMIQISLDGYLEVVRSNR